MKKRVKDLFLKALLTGVKGFILLPIILYVINDTQNIYGYTQDQSSFSIKLFLIVSLLFLISLTFIIFTKFKTWKILMCIVFAIVYVLMHYYSSEIIHANQRSICIEGNYKDCNLKGRFEEP